MGSPMESKLPCCAAWSKLTSPTGPRYHASSPAGIFPVAAKLHRRRMIQTLVCGW